MLLLRFPDTKPKQVQVQFKVAKFHELFPQYVATDDIVWNQDNLAIIYSCGIGVYQRHALAFVTYTFFEK